VVILIPTPAPVPSGPAPAPSNPVPATQPVVSGGDNHGDGEHHHGHGDMPFWDFRESIPGEPGDDYPILDKIPETAFTCEGRLEGNVIVGDFY
jgi:hypothetical protein